MTIDPEILKAAERLQQQLAEFPYSTCGFSVTVHAGEVRRIDYTLSVKTMPADTAGGRNNGRRS